MAAWLAWAGLLAIAAPGCSPSQGSSLLDGGAPSADADLVPCLFCNDAASDVGLALQVKGRIDQVCSSPDGCHGQGQGGLFFSYGNELPPMINVTSTEVSSLSLVAPGDPAGSYAYRKIACDGGYVLSCMPKGGRFDPNFARIFFEWIEAGAPLE